MPDTKDSLPPAPPPVAKLPDARDKASGQKLVSIACNLPHGLTIAHEGQKVTLRGANDPRAIDTDTTRSGRWGITHDVPEEWFDSWAATAHPAVRNGNIVKNTRAKIEAHAENLGNEVKTGTDPIDPKAKGMGVEPADADADKDPD